VRFRIVKLAPGTPEAPDMPAAGVAVPRIEAEPAGEVPAADMPAADMPVATAPAVEVPAGEPA